VHCVSDGSLQTSYDLGESIDQSIVGSDGSLYALTTDGDATLKPASLVTRSCAKDSQTLLAPAADRRNWRQRGKSRNHLLPRSQRVAIRFQCCVLIRLFSKPRELLEIEIW